MGRILSAVHRKKQSLNRKGKTKSVEWGQKMSEILKGKIRNTEQRERISNAHIGLVLNGTNFVTTSGKNGGQMLR